MKSRAFSNTTIRVYYQIMTENWAYNLYWTSFFVISKDSVQYYFITLEFNSTLTLKLNCRFSRKRQLCRTWLKSRRDNENWSVDVLFFILKQSVWKRKGISVERNGFSALGKLTLTQHSGIMAKLHSNDCFHQAFVFTQLSTTWVRSCFVCSLNLVDWFRWKRLRVSALLMY